MGQQTISLSKKTIEKMKQHYKNQLGTPPQWAVFRAKTNNAVITAYQSGKVLFQGANPEAEVSKWYNGESTAQGKKVSEKKQHSYHPPEGIFHQNHIGSDESGTGDYFGPITTCAVYVKEEQIPLLKEIGIQDSKQITDENIKKLSSYLLEMNIPYSLMVLHNEKYNQLQKQGWTQGKMKTMLHASCIRSLKEKIVEEPCKGIIIDQFCMPTVYEKHLKSEGRHLDPQTYFMTKAENYSIAVAAGSVIARASFVQEMEKLGNIAGVPLLKGASGKVDKLIANIIKRHGEGILPSIAKVHFANTTKAKKLLR